MNVLPVNFHTLRIFGLWYEEPRRLWPLKLFHQCLVVSLNVHFTVCQLVTLVLMRDAGVEAITACLFLSLTYVSASYKLLYFVRDRPNLEDLLDKFRLEVCQPRNPEELAIAHRHHAVIKEQFVVRMTTTLLCAFTILSQSFLGEDKQLPVNAYMVFNITGDIGFAVAYAVQFVTTVCTIGVDVCFDTTACAFIILISCQLELLCHRIATVGGRNFKEYVLHHNLIYVMTKKVHASFINIILPAFFCGLVTLCSSIYQLAQAKESLFDFLGFLLYFGVLLNQLYYYCWCGNELQFKSGSVTDAIFRSDWTTLSPLERRNYWFIMSMGQTNLVISYHGQCTLSLCTYIWVVKTSYGAYNLLQQVSSKT